MVSTKLDYSIQSADDRSKFILELLPTLTKEQLKSEKYLEILSDYIVSAMTPNEKKQKLILTDNRLITVNKRETSMQKITESLESGEDGLFHLAIEEDKNVLLTHKKSITDDDLVEIPSLKDLKESISLVETLEKKAKGKDRYKLKKWLIELHQEQYIIKDLFKPVVNVTNTGIKNLTKISLNENITINANGEPVSDCAVNLFNPTHVCALLGNYSALKEDGWGKFTWDFWYLMEDLDNLIEKTLSKKYPFYYRLLIHKIDGRSNAEIQKLLEKEFGTTYTIEYLSSLWRNKIPKMIAEQAKEDYLIWYYTYVERGKWKKCSRCGQVKLANNRFFSKNNTAKDGWYSICKECRNAKNKKGVE